MALAHTPLDGAVLGADAQRALASPATKLMAARGMAPIANPRDLLSLMYQLALEADEALSSSAKKTLGDLPVEVLRAGLSDEGCDARVLDFVAPKVASQVAILEAIVLNRSVADETVASIAAFGPERVIEIVATNEERLLRHPTIIYSMYVNDKARMSTVDRAVELAVRNNTVVPGLQAWDEICQAVLESASAKAEESADDTKSKDDAFSKALSEEEEVATKDKAWRDMTIPEKIRMATIGPAAARNSAVNDSKLIVAFAALKSPMVKEKDVIKWAGLQALDKRIIAYIAKQRDWTKAYAMKLTLCQNPKTPVRDAMKFVVHLRDKDVRALSRSRNVPGPVSQLARKLMNSRQSGGKK